MSNETPDIGQRIAEAFDGLDMSSAISLIFGKCPKCGERMVQGRWLRWCPHRVCGYYAVLNRAAGNKIEQIKPRTEMEEKVLSDLAAEYGVVTT